MEQVKRKTDIWSIFVYLIVYSIAGFVIETTFGIFTKGVIESRKSFLYGPFCSIYGIGAIVMILALRNQKNIGKLFFGGAMIGAIIEYAMSFFCEKIFGVKWWDYSNAWLNVDGRTCIGYAISWGFLAILLIRIVNPYVDKLINSLKEKNNIFKVATLFIIAFFTADAIVTSYALKIFYYRISVENNLNIENKAYIQKKYTQISQDSKLFGFINHYFDDEKMIKTYPNIMISEINKNTIYVDSLLDGMESYYYRLGDAL